MFWWLPSLSSGLEIEIYGFLGVFFFFLLNVVFHIWDTFILWILFILFRITFFLLDYNFVSHVSYLLSSLCLREAMDQRLQEFKSEFSPFLYERIPDLCFIIYKYWLYTSLSLYDDGFYILFIFSIKDDGFCLFVQKI